MEMKGVKDILYGGNLIKDMHIVVGRTGAGKNLLQMIGMDFHERLMSQSTDAYFMLYKCNDEEDSFAVEVFRNKGLVWQECSDIIDIIWILRQFDDKYFTQNHFHYPIIEIEEQDKRFNDLFERMGQYHKDQSVISTIDAVIVGSARSFQHIYSKMRTSENSAVITSKGACLKNA